MLRVVMSKIDIDFISLVMIIVGFMVWPRDQERASSLCII